MKPHDAPRCSGSGDLYVSNPGGRVECRICIAQRKLQKLPRELSGYLATYHFRYPWHREVHSK